MKKLLTLALAVLMIVGCVATFSACSNDPYKDLTYVDLGLEREYFGIAFRSGSDMTRKVEDITVQGLEEYLRKQRSPDVVFIDSIQYFTDQFEAKAEEIVQLRKKFRSKIFIFTSHVEGKEVEGKAAYVVKRDSFVRIQVEGFRAIYKGRGRGGAKGYYTIWEEGAQKYWLENEHKE